MGREKGVRDKIIKGRRGKEGVEWGRVRKIETDASTWIFVPGPPISQLRHAVLASLPI